MATIRRKGLGRNLHQVAPSTSISIKSRRRCNFRRHIQCRCRVRRRKKNIRRAVQCHLRGCYTRGSIPLKAKQWIEAPVSVIVSVPWLAGLVCHTSGKCKSFWKLIQVCSASTRFIDATLLLVCSIFLPSETKQCSCSASSTPAQYL